MRIIKIANNQPTGTNPPISNQSQPAFKMKFSEKPYQVQELTDFLSRFNTHSSQIMNELEKLKVWLADLTINDNHPVLSIKPKGIKGVNGNVTVTFTVPSGREISETILTEQLTASASPQQIAVTIKGVIQDCFDKVAGKAPTLDRRNDTIVDNWVNDFIKGMNEQA